MTGAEILLLVIGVVFFVASFFITEKLGPGELNKIGELSNDEIQKVMERELQRVNSERSMEKECNEKIMAISEYSDTVVESMNKTHNEIMFLYSMLNDKHSELTGLASKLQELSSELKRKDEEMESYMTQKSYAEEMIDLPAFKKDEPAMAIAEEPQRQAAAEPEEAPGEFEGGNHNAAILALHQEGKSAIDIARELALGLGEVQLVIGLYEGKKKK